MCYKNISEPKRMNKYHKSIIFLIVALVVTGILAPTEDARASITENSEIAAKHTEVINPKIPTFIKFAEKKIDIDQTDRWERLDRELTAMIYTHGNTLLAIKRANRYFPVIAPILKHNGIPEDMIYLAVIESTLNPRAYSPAKAAGIWQFMPATAKEYGLEVNEDVDERYNISKATEAACKYFKKSYAKYGKWESVAAAYNGGMARITKELSTQQVDSAYDLYLADETMRYIFRLLAMKLILESPKDYGFRIAADQLYQPLEYDSVEVAESIDDWATWAKQQGINYMILRENNPWIRSKTLPNKSGKTYIVNIPTKESLSRSRQKKSVYNPAWVSVN